MKRKSLPSSVADEVIPDAMGDASSAWPVLMLLVSVLVDDPDLGRPRSLGRLAGTLRLCADFPDLAVLALGCPERQIDPALLRRTAALLSPRIAE